MRVRTHGAATAGRLAVVTAAAAITTTLATTLTGAGVAGAAVNQYTILANSPKPEVCDNHGTIPAGTWLQNKPCGYFIGTAMSGTTFDVHSTTANNYHYGRSHGDNNLCGWIPPSALSDTPTGTTAESCSAAIEDAIGHRRSFGRDFNAAPHEATDGSAISVDPSCQTYFNYYTSSSYDTGALRDPAGTAAAEVRYRFTTNGADPAMVVRDDVRGWVFMDRDCVTDWRDVTFDNQDD